MPVVHRITCAAAVRGCQSYLLWESESTEVDEGFLKLNGWQMRDSKIDGRYWACGLHEERPADLLTQVR